MKYTRILALMIGSAALLSSCSDDELAPGNPVMQVTGDLGSACFGDSLTFSINASDSEVPLSTIHAELYFGDEMVSEEVIRTKESGKDYEVKIGVPYMANIPDAKATLRLTLQNIHFTTTEQLYQVSLTHPDYPQLTFRAEDGTEYTMKRDAQYEYSMTQRFPAELRGVIVAPAMGDFGNEIVFGYENSEIKPGAEGMIPFSNSAPGRYTISFNTFSFEGSPFVVLSMNGQNFEAIDETTSKLDLTLSKGDVLTPAGFPNFNDWWINPDYFVKNADGTLTFNAYQGSYRIIADTKMQYFRVYKLMGSDPATLNDDGTGALWIIGNGIGHPSLANTVGWTTEKALCMAPVGEKTYQITVVGGKTIDISNIDFKFFGQMGWGVELKSANLVSKTNLIGVGAGKDVNGHDDGNLFLEDGVELQDNGVYVITVDLSQGINGGVMTMEFKGEQQFEEKPIYLNNQKMTTNDNQRYSVVLEMKQGSTLEFREFSEIDGLYVDPDYFNFDEEAFAISFLPVNGHYNVILDKLAGTLSAQRVNADGSKMSLQPDGSGALWLMGWGVGSPDMSNQFGWDLSSAYCMAEVKPCVFQFTGKAGPEKGSAYGDRFRTDYIDMKFFHECGWNGEYAGGSLELLTSLLKASEGSNFDLADGVQLEAGATYRLTIDLTKGTDKGTLNMVKL